MFTLALLTLLGAAEPDACREYFAKRAVQTVALDFDGDRKPDAAYLVRDPRGLRLTIIRGGSNCQTWFTEEVNQFSPPVTLRVMPRGAAPKKAKARGGVQLLANGKPAKVYYYDAGRKGWAAR
jgi:hypothetical protein